MTQQVKIIVTKASGEQAPFSEKKLKRSLMKSGADLQTVNEIIDEIKQQLYDGISTRVIYSRAFDMLKKQSKPIAAKYKLKKAIMELGPSGYPFEQYFAEILKEQGYKTKVGEIVQGNCVFHEVDVIAEKDNLHIMIECKFRTMRGNKTDVKVPLYIHSRFQDLKRKWENDTALAGKDFQGWVVTNTKFSTDAIQYGKCVGLNLIAWDYPKEGSLRELVDKAHLYPLTCLSTITSHEKHQLLTGGTVLCKELKEHPDILTNAGIANKRLKAIMAEINGLY